MSAIELAIQAMFRDGPAQGAGSQEDIWLSESQRTSRANAAKALPLGRLIAEAPGNPQHQVVLTDQAYHRWFVEPGTSACAMPVGK